MSDAGAPLPVEGPAMAMGDAVGPLPVEGPGTASLSGVSTGGVRLKCDASDPLMHLSGDEFLELISGSTSSSLSMLPRDWITTSSPPEAGADTGGFEDGIFETEQKSNKGAVLWIRVHSMRIRIQSYFSMRIRIQIKVF